MEIDREAGQFCRRFHIGIADIVQIWRAKWPSHEVRRTECISARCANLASVMSNISTMGRIPEARVLIIMTGGTICMQKSPNGFVPARNFLERCMAPRPEFNDGESHDPIEVRFNDGPDGVGELQSLRTPTSVYGKRVRQVNCPRAVGLACLAATRIAHGRKAREGKGLPR
jgi:hypothetical protein